MNSFLLHPSLLTHTYFGDLSHGPLRIRLQTSGSIQRLLQRLQSLLRHSGNQVHKFHWRPIQFSKTHICISHHFVLRATALYQKDYAQPVKPNSFCKCRADNVLSVHSLLMFGSCAPRTNKVVPICLSHCALLQAFTANPTPCKRKAQRKSTIAMHSPSPPGSPEEPTSASRPIPQ